MEWCIRATPLPASCREGNSGTGTASEQLRWHLQVVLTTYPQPEVPIYHRFSPTHTPQRAGAAAVPASRHSVSPARVIRAGLGPSVGQQPAPDPKRPKKGISTQKQGAQPVFTQLEKVMWKTMFFSESETETKFKRMVFHWVLQEHLKKASRKKIFTHPVSKFNFL